MITTPNELIPFCHQRPRWHRPKSDRRWGAIYGFIRDRIRKMRRKRFTPRDFSPPLTRVQALGNLRGMWLAGELVRVKGGPSGARITPVYERKG